MKEIKAIIRPNKLNALRDKLMQVPGFPGMTVTKVEGCSAPARNHPDGHAGNYKEALIDFTPKIRIEIIAADEAVEALVACIASVSQTGQIGDGLIWIADIERAWFLFKTMPGAPT